MKKVFLLSFAMMLLVGFAHAQFFEGYVRYVHNLEITDTTLQKKDFFLSYLLGSSSTLYIKGTNFHWKFAGCQMESQIYLSSSNTIYEKFPKKDTLFTSPAGVADEIILKDELKPSKVEVLGNKCQVLMLKSKFTKDNSVRGRIYYFAKKYPLHPDFMRKYKRNANDLVFGKVVYLPLRFTYVYPSFRITYHAVEVKETKVDEELFNVSKFPQKPLPTRK